MAGTDYRIQIGNEFSRTSKALRAVDSTMPAKLRKELMDAVKPAVAQAKQKVRSIPAVGLSGSTGLRRRIARGVRIQASAGKSASLRVVATMPDYDERNLPLALDNPADGWRHPVFGNRHVWVPQHTGAPWFVSTMEASDDDILRAVSAVLDRAAREVAAAGA
jgi:hypothetical protein